MAEPSANTEHPRGSDAEPGARGRLRVADRVVERVAIQAAREVDGVVATSESSLERAVGRGYPKADAEVAGDRVRVTMQVATRWPTPLAQAARDVRSAVTERLETMVGLHVDAVDVHAARVVLDDDSRPARRVR